jgi:hypothetical protein
VFDGPIDAGSPPTWIVQFLALDLSPRDIVLMDHRNSHKTKVVPSCTSCLPTAWTFDPFRGHEAENTVAQRKHLDVSVARIMSKSLRVPWLVSFAPELACGHTTALEGPGRSLLKFAPS